jgi:hypothetical protein
VEQFHNHLESPARKGPAIFCQEHSLLWFLYRDWSSLVMSERYGLFPKFSNFVQFFNNALVSKPLQTKLRPSGKRVLFGPKGEPVTALLKKMHTNGCTGFFQSIGINWTSRKEAFIVFGGYNQGWADFTGNSKLLTQLLLLLMG